MTINSKTEKKTKIKVCRYNMFLLNALNKRIYWQEKKKKHLTPRRKIHKQPTHSVTHSFLPAFSNSLIGNCTTKALNRFWRQKSNDSHPSVGNFKEPWNRGNRRWKYYLPLISIICFFSVFYYTSFVSLLTHHDVGCLGLTSFDI